MKSGRFYVYKKGRKFLVEPISEHVDRGGDWGHTDLSNRPIGGAVHPDDSIISDETHANIITLGPGVSPLDYIDRLVNNEIKND